jgi:1-acyl-sn-glycerol-3-phosphate acyltransferase
LSLRLPTTFGHWRSWLFTIPVAVLVTAVMVTTSIIIGVVARLPRFQRLWYRWWGAAVLGVMGVRVRLLGEEHLEPGRNYIIVSNHMSLVDTPLMFRCMPVDFKFLAKRELLKVPFIGWYLRSGGHLTVDRGSVRSAISSMNEAAKLARERHLSVLIFPEGTRSTAGIQPFKEGAAYLAIAAQIPIAPVAIVGSDQVLPARSSWFRSGTVEVRIGPPIDTSGRTLKERAEITLEAENRVKALFL